MSNPHPLPSPRVSLSLSLEPLADFAATYAADVEVARALRASGAWRPWADSSPGGSVWYADPWEELGEPLAGWQASGGLQGRRCRVYLVRMPEPRLHGNRYPAERGRWALRDVETVGPAAGYGITRFFRGEAAARAAVGGGALRAGDRQLLPRDGLGRSRRSAGRRGRPRRALARLARRAQGDAARLRASARLRRPRRAVDGDARAVRGARRAGWVMTAEPLPIVVTGGRRYADPLRAKARPRAADEGVGPPLQGAASGSVTQAVHSLASGRGSHG